MEANLSYSIDDWVVHSFYGVGQIRRIETRPIQGESKQCFKVNTKDSTYWFPVTENENPRIRPVASEDIIHRVIKNLRRKASTMDTDRKYWKSRIDEVRSNADMLSTSNLYRDLSSQRVIRKLNQTEDDALAYFEERLLREWATIVDEEIAKLRIQLHSYIETSKAKVVVDG